MKNVGELAIFGAPPEFESALHVGQLNLPDIDELDRAIRGIFDRRWFANHGPLSRELDRRFADFVGAKHAVSVTNGTVALMVMLSALQKSGAVIVPAFTFPATAQAIVWAGLRPIFCDVDPDTHNLTADTVRSALTADTVAILGVHLWGRACDPDGLAALADERGLHLLFDASHAVACSYDGRPIGGIGDAQSFSFHATKILNGLEGGAITTNDDLLADRMRTIRSFHPSETHAPVALRLNGKMSEMQAAFALASLDDVAENAARNRSRYEAYRSLLSDIRGLRFVDYAGREASNFQYVVVEVTPGLAGISRDDLYEILLAENVVCRRHFHPGAHRMPPFSQLLGYAELDLPVTDALCGRVLLLPNGSAISNDEVSRICRLIRDIVGNADAINARRRAMR